MKGTISTFMGIAITVVVIAALLFGVGYNMIESNFPKRLLAIFSKKGYN